MNQVHRTLYIDNQGNYSNSQIRQCICQVEPGCVEIIINNSQKKKVYIQINTIDNTHKLIQYSQENMILLKTTPVRLVRSNTIIQYSDLHGIIGKPGIQVWIKQNYQARD